MDTKIYVAKWTNGTFSIFLGAGPEGIVDAVDSVGDPAEVEVRVLPMKLRDGWLIFDQEEVDGRFRLEVGEITDLHEALWKECRKVVWPTKRKDRPNQRPERNAGATSPLTSESTPGVAHP